MKQVNELRFPYPFLCEDGGDYIDSSFTIDLNLTKIDNQLEMTCKYNLKCPFLEEQIAKNNALVVIHIEQRTHREVLQLKENSNIKIDLSKLSPNHNLEVVGMVIAIKDFQYGYHPCMNEIYSYFEEDFKCEKMSILAYSNFVEFELPTESKISSIFTISEYKDPNDIAKGEPYKIDLSGDVIDIKVLPKIKDAFVNLREKEISHNKLFNSLFVYPAIQLAVMEMFKNYDLYKEYKWCISLANKLSNEKECSFDVLRAGKVSIDKDEILEYTHIILEDLLLASFLDASGGDD